MTHSVGLPCVSLRVADGPFFAIHATWTQMARAAWACSALSLSKARPPLQPLWARWRRAVIRQSCAKKPWQPSARGARVIASLASSTTIGIALISRPPPSYAAEAVRALHYAFADHLDDAAEDLDRTAVVGPGRLDASPQAQGWQRWPYIQRRCHHRLHGRLRRSRLRLHGRRSVAISVNPFVGLPIAKGRCQVRTGAERH